MSYVSGDNERTVGRSIAGLVSFATAWFLGMNALIPLIFGVGAFLILKKVKRHSPELRILISTLAAQTGWFLLGVAIMPNMLSAVAADVVIDLVLVSWLLFRPSYVAFAFVAITQFAFLCVNAYVLLSAENMQQGKALLAHIILRCAILAAVAVSVYRKMRPEALQVADEPA